MERTETTATIDPESPQAEARRQLFNEWILENPPRAIRTATQLLSPRTARIFTTYVSQTLETGLNGPQIASSMNISFKNYSRNIRSARIALSSELGLQLEGRTTNKTLARITLEKRTKEVFEKAKNSDISASQEIVHLYQRDVNQFAESLDEQYRTRFISEVSNKLLLTVPKIEWMGAARFHHYFRQILRSAQRDQNRKIQREKAKEERTQNFKNKPQPPRDLLELWADKHPRAIKRILADLTPTHRTLYEQQSKGRSIEQMRESVGFKNANSVKVTLNKIRNRVLWQTNIRLPQPYRPISELAATHSIYENVYDKIKAGKVKGAVNLFGRYYITQQIFDSLVVQNPTEQYLQKLFGFFQPFLADSDQSRVLARDVLDRFKGTFDANDPQNVRSLNKLLFRQCLRELKKLRQEHPEANSNALTMEQKVIMALHFGANLDYHDTSAIMGKDQRSVFAIVQQAVKSKG